MNSRIAYNDKNGDLWILTPNPEYFKINSPERKLLESRGVTFKSDEEALAWIAKKDVPLYRSFMLNGETEDDAKLRLGISDLDENVPSDIMDVNVISSDREFRNAWEYSNKAITINMTKANNIKREGFRVLREPILKELDKQYLLADEQNDITKKAEIVLKKNELRDVTNFQDIQDLSQLKDYMPAILVS